MPLEAIKELQKAIDKLKSVLQPGQGPFLQQPTTMEQQCHSQKKKEEGPRSEVHSRVATQLEAAVKGKKFRSCISLSSAEVFAKWDRGLCEWCDESYSPGHKCTKIGPNTLLVVGAEEAGPRQPDCGVENPPSVDALQVFEESPEMRSNLCVQEEFSKGGQMEDGDSQVQVCECADLKSSCTASSNTGGDEEPLESVENLTALQFVTVEPYHENVICRELSLIHI